MTEPGYEGVPMLEYGDETLELIDIKSLEFGDSPYCVGVFV
jgi:hypothetical protein